MTGTGIDKDTGIDDDMGIGAALHQHPPGYVRTALNQQNSTGAPEHGRIQNGLCTTADLEAISQYDRKCYDNRTAEEFLKKWAEQQTDGDVSEDISDGRRFAWWLWLANLAQGPALCERTVNFVFCVRRDGRLAFELRFSEGAARLTLRSNKVEITMR